MPACRCSVTTDPQVRGMFGYDASNYGYDSAETFASLCALDTRSNGILSTWSQRFTGKERDSETGLDFFQARYYSGAQGRFTSPDEFTGGIVDPITGQQVGQPGPLPYADIWDPQTINKYAYVRNSPLRYVDPDGHNAVAGMLGGVEIGIFICGPVCSIAGGIIGGAVGAYLSYEAGKAIGGALRREKTRDSEGKFAPTRPGDTQPGSEGEAAADRYIEAEGHRIQGTQIPVTSNGKKRVYDTVYTDKDTGETVGVETKSGDARNTPQQRGFDQNVSKQNPAKAGPKGQQAGIKQVERVRDMRVPRKPDGK